MKEIDIVAEPPPVVKESGDHVNIHVTGTVLSRTNIAILGEETCQTITLPKSAGEVTSTVGDESVDISVRPLVNDEFFVLIQCQNGKELIKVDSVEGHEKTAKSYPEHFLLRQNTTATLSEPLEVRIKTDIKVCLLDFLHDWG